MKCSATFLFATVLASLEICTRAEALDYGEFYPAYYEQYKRVSFDDLEGTPGKFAGTEICVEGYLGPNYNYSDTDAYTALYEHPFDPTYPASVETKNRAIALDPVYLKQLQILRKRWAGKKVRLYGFYFVPPNLSERARLHRIPRIDRVVLAASLRK